MSDPETWRREHLGDPQQLPPEIDVTVPSVARIYDYALGGKNNFQIDRDTVAALLAEFPGTVPLAVDNRAFLRRAVRYLVAEAGVRQIIDIGSGLPTAGNVHEIAHEIDPAVRVVYVDHDPIVLAHARALLADNDTTTVIQADAGEPQAIFDAPETRQLIDLDRPYAVLLAGLLHHLPDSRDPLGVARYIRDRMPSGSHLLLSNVLDDDDERARTMEREMEAKVGTGRFRMDRAPRVLRGLRDGGARPRLRQRLAPGRPHRRQQPVAHVPDGGHRPQALNASGRAGQAPAASSTVGVEPVTAAVASRFPSTGAILNRFSP